MKIILNNRDFIVDRDEISLEELIQMNSFSFKMLVTKVNGTLIKKENRKSTLIRDGDQVAIIHLISGG